MLPGGTRPFVAIEKSHGGNSKLPLRLLMFAVHPVKKVVKVDEGEERQQRSDGNDGICNSYPPSITRARSPQQNARYASYSQSYNNRAEKPSWGRRLNDESRY
jgi:hypothetical protein